MSRPWEIVPGNKKTKWVVASTIGTAGLVTAVFLVRFSPTLWEEYLIHRLSGTDAQTQADAASALAERGVLRAIGPLLAAEKDAAPSRTREEYLRESILVRAVRTICKKHENKTAVLAVLESLYNEDPSVLLIVLAMTPELGELSLPFLRLGLENEAYLIREQAIMMAGTLGDYAAPLAPDLAQRLGRENHHVRRAAARALGRIGNTSPEIILALQECVASTRDDDLRNAALETLEKLLALGRQHPSARR